MLVCLIFFLIMGVRMVSRVHQLDVALDATTQRVAEMLVGLETLEKLSTGIADLSKRQEDLTKIQTSIEDRIDTALKQTEAMTQKVPVETAKQVASKSDTMIKQVQSVGSGLQAQSRAVQDLSREVQSLKSGLGQVDALKKDVEALVSLQRERYLEVLQKIKGLLAALQIESSSTHALPPATNRRPADLGIRRSGRRSPKRTGHWVEFCANILQSPLQRAFCHLTWGLQNW